MSTRFNRQPLLAASIILATSATHTQADTLVSWSNGYPYEWSASQKWGLDPACGLFPTKGMPPCCMCSGEDRWFVTVDTSTGPRLDVDAELVGLDHRMGQISLDNHTLLVTESCTLGDSDPLTAPPWLYGPTNGLFISTTLLHIIESNTLISVNTFLNDGLMLIDPGVRFSFGAGMYTNGVTGQMHFLDDAILDGYGSTPTVTNLGLILKSGSGHVDMHANLNSSGPIDLNGGSMSLSRISNVSGPISIASGAQLQIGGSGSSATIDGSVTGDGSFEVSDGMIVDVNGPFDIGGELRVHTRGELTFNVAAFTHDLMLDANSGTWIAGTLTVENWLDWQAGLLQNGTFDILGSGVIERGEFSNAYLHVSPASTIDINAIIRGDNGGLLHNEGIVRLNNSTGLLSYGINDSEFLNEGTLERTGPVLSTVDMRLRNRGLFILRDGALLQHGEFIQDAGETRLDNGSITAASVDMEFEDGMLTGGGTIAGLAHFHADAMIAPGLVDDGTGNPVMDELIVHSVVLDPGARSCFKLAGTSKGVDYDTVTGYGGSVYTIGGSLEIRMENGFENAVQQHDMFVIMDTPSTPIAGNFDGITSGQRVPTSNGEGTFIIYYGPTSPFGANQVCLTGYRRSANNGSGTSVPVGSVVQR